MDNKLDFLMQMFALVIFAYLDLIENYLKTSYYFFEQVSNQIDEIGNLSILERYLNEKYLIHIEFLDQRCQLLKKKYHLKLF